MALLGLLRVSPPQARVRPGIHRQWVGAHDGNPCRLQALNFLRAIGQEPDRADPQIPQDCRRARELAGLGRIAEAAVGLSLGPALGLERPAAQEGQMSIAPALLIEPDDEAVALLRDQRVGERHLLAAVTFKAVEDVGAQARRVHASEPLRRTPDA